MDEEAQKRNTDCVYFLASPLTCKKGNECEYRHSESARINPRHCWYWLSGNCLNPHCAFRHPPLEGQPTTSGTESLTTSGSSNKSRVPCYYFFQGYCAKGDQCLFMHVPPFGGNQAVSNSQKTTKVTGMGAESQPVEKKAPSGADNGTVKPTSMQSTSAEVQLLTEDKRVAEVGSPQGHAKKRGQHAPERSLPEAGFSPINMLDASDNELSFFTRSHVHKVQPTDDWLDNDMESEEWLEESSPGFDVLVDDGPEQLGFQEEAEYLSNFDMEQGQELTHGRERIIPMTDEMLHFDYEGMHDDLCYTEGGNQYAYRSYDPYEEHIHSSYDQVNWHKRKTFDGRVPEGTVVSERRDLSLERYPRQSEKTDLRHRLGKIRRVDRTQIDDKSKRRLQSDSRSGDFQRGHRQRGNEQRYHHDAIARRQQVTRHSKMRVHSRTPSGSGSLPRGSVHEVEPNFEEIPEKVHRRSLSGRNDSSEHFRNRHKETERGRIYADVAASSESSVFRKPFNRNETGKNATDFAKPKTLEQIKEEKRKNALLGNGPRACDTSEESKTFFQSGQRGSQGAIPKSQIEPLDSLSGEERKINFSKVRVHESSKFPTFEGPKPLSAILKAKQKPKNDDIVAGTHAQGAGDISKRSELTGISRIPETDWKTPVLSSGAEKKVQQKGFSQGAKHMHESARNGSINVSSRVSTDFNEGDTLLQNNRMPVMRQNNGDLTMNGAINSHVDKGDTCLEPLKIENGGMTGNYKSESESDEEYLEEDEEDDFAKKLGGFFS